MKYLLLGLCLLGSCAHSTTHNKRTYDYEREISINTDPDTRAQYPIRNIAFLANLKNPLRVEVILNSLLELTQGNCGHMEDEHKYQYLTQYGPYRYRIPVKEGKDLEGFINFQNGRVELPIEAILEKSLTTSESPAHKVEGKTLYIPYPIE